MNLGAWMLKPSQAAKHVQLIQAACKTLPQGTATLHNHCPGPNVVSEAGTAHRQQCQVRAALW